MPCKAQQHCTPSCHLNRHRRCLRYCSASPDNQRSVVLFQLLINHIALGACARQATMRAAVQVLLVLLALKAVHAQAAGPPVERRIVDDLTPVLLQQLQQANISLLLVLPGAKPHSTMKLNWHDAAGAIERINFVYTYEGFVSHWHGYRRYHRWHQMYQVAEGIKETASQQRVSTDDKLQGASTDAPLKPSEFDDIHPVVNPTPPKIALLIRAEDGAVRSSQANLAAAITRQLSRLHVMTVTHSTHQDKGDSLVVFDGAGLPVQANFLASTVFRDAFNDIYEKNLWGSGAAGGEGSGLGSSLEYTATIRAALPALIKKYGISSLLDSSCGSMHWMPLVLREAQGHNKGFRFMGTDVVCSLIDKHLKTFEKEKDWDFKCIDYSNQRLPSGYDLVWSRDSLQHIPMHGAWQFLNNVKASGAKYLLVGSYITSNAPNSDIKAGDGYPIDLLKPPFKLSAPLEIIDEKTADGKHMLLFDVQKMTWEDPLDGLV